MTKIHSLGLTNQQTLKYLQLNGYTNITWSQTQGCYYADKL